MPTIVVLDSDPDVVSAVVHRLERSGLAPRVVGSTDTEEVLELIEQGEVQVLVTDILGGGHDALTMVYQARRRAPHLPILVISASVDSRAPDRRRIDLRYTVPGSNWNGSSIDRSRIEAALTTPRGL